MTDPQWPKQRDASETRAWIAAQREKATQRVKPIEHVTPEEWLATWEQMAEEFIDMMARQQALLRYWKQHEKELPLPIMAQAWLPILKAAEFGNVKDIE